MNKNDARKIADVITPEQFNQMLDNAKNGIKDWSKTSAVNHGMTKGTAWNILSKVDPTNKRGVNILGIKNAIWEFGDFLLEDILIYKKKKKSLTPPIHQDPIFGDELSSELF